MSNSSTLPSDQEMARWLMFNSFDQGLSEADVAPIVQYGKQHGLNPMLNELYCKRSPESGLVVPVIGVAAVQRLVSEREDLVSVSYLYAEELFAVAGVAAGLHGDSLKLPMWIECVITLGTESESRQSRQYTSGRMYLFEQFWDVEMWQQQPLHNLKHKALKEAVKIAFGLSGVSDIDEMKRMAQNQPPANLQVQPGSASSSVDQQDQTVAGDELPEFDDDIDMVIVDDEVESTVEAIEPAVESDRLKQSEPVVDTVTEQVESVAPSYQLAPQPQQAPQHAPQQQKAPQARVAKEVQPQVESQPRPANVRGPGVKPTKVAEPEVPLLKDSQVPQGYRSIVKSLENAAEAQASSADQLLTFANTMEDPAIKRWVEHRHELLQRKMEAA